jgi:dolichol-phosphate mannosyltransferase
MLKLLKTDDLDLVVGSRFLGNTVKGLSAQREKMSRFGNKLCRYVTKASLSDPLSGFFMIRRNVIEQNVSRLSNQGFKILLDIMATHTSPLKFKEIGFQFRERVHGESKLDTLVLLEFFKVLLEKTIGRYLSPQLVFFMGVGGLGALVHFSILSLCFKHFHVNFLTSQTLATYTSMTFNFFLNNFFTYRDQRKKGLKVLSSFFLFILICSVGAFLNISVSDYLFQQGWNWIISGFVGILAGAFWNYITNSTLTWKSKP